MLSVCFVCPSVRPCAGVEQLLSELGRLLAVMHDGVVVHGNLSSSCIIVRDADQALVRQTIEKGNWRACAVTSTQCINCCDSGANSLSSHV